MGKLEKTILWVLRAAQEFGINDLSKLQIHKIVYLIEIEARKFSGESFFTEDVTFQREKMGPISVQVYNALNNINKYVDVIISDGQNYTAPRHGYRLKKSVKIDQFKLPDGDMLFLGSVIQDYIDLNQGQLKKIAYNTEPMEEIINQEKKEKSACKAGVQLNMSLVTVDEELVRAIADG